MLQQEQLQKKVVVQHVQQAQQVQEEQLNAQQQQAYSYFCSVYF
jgi:hypothetical protein